MGVGFCCLSKLPCSVPKALAPFPPQLPTCSLLDTCLLSCSTSQLLALIMAPSRFNPTTSRPLLPPAPAQVTQMTPTRPSEFSVVSSKAGSGLPLFPLSVLYYVEVISAGLCPPTLWAPCGQGPVFPSFLTPQHGQYSQGL